eukprot:9264144-Pyramimonas_sp.AAC.1
MPAFAQFYEDLHASTRPEHSPSTCTAVGGNRAPPFSMEELESATRQLKLHQVADDNGARAEMVKIDDQVLRDLLLDTFELLNPSS